MSVESAAEFCSLLEQSHLLDEEQMRRVRDFAAGQHSLRGLAKRIVQQGWLTRWQARQLLAGRHKLYLGKYKLLDNIGVGGMGAVFKAEHPRLNRVVALKVMSRELLKNREAVARFIREIRSAAALNHPNIVTAYDADEVRGTYFLVMEYVEGGDLKAWIAQHERLPVAWSCEVIRQAALGLQHAHENNLIHRDIKPSNLLIVAGERLEFPQVKILDLGLARFVSEVQEAGGLTKTGQIMGTPDYIAPEQTENSRGADIRADIFSLGCTLFRMLTGRVPFEGNGLMEKLMARVRRDAPRVRDLRPKVPARLDAVVAKLLARDPNDRFQTPAQVAATLAPFALATMPQATRQTLVLKSKPTAGKVEARADTTMNEFLDALDDEAVAEAPAEKTPAAASGRRRRSQVDPRWVYGGTAAAILLVIGILWLIGGPKNDNSKATSTPPDDSPIVLNKKKPKAGASLNPDRSVMEWLASPGTSIEMTVVMEGQAAKSVVQLPNVLPQDPFKIHGIAFRTWPAKLKPADLQRLQKLRLLTSLTFHGPETDAKGADFDFSGLGVLKTVRTLRIENIPLNAQSLKGIARMRKLQFLYLSRNGIDNKTVEHLGDLVELQQLHLRGQTGFSGNCLKLVQWMPKLKSLDLMESPVTFITTRQLIGATSLEVLGLRGISNLNDSVIAPLQRHVSLRELDLADTTVTDAIIPYLESMPKLQRVDLRGTKLTDAAVLAFQKRHPQWAILWDGATRLSNGWIISKPVKLGHPFNSANVGSPTYLSPGGLTMLVARAGGHGGADLWQLTRADTSKPFGQPVNLGPGVNTEANETWGQMSSDGLTLVFQSDRNGNMDLLMSTRKSVDQPFGKAVHLGRGVNTRSRESTPSLSADGRTIIFHVWLDGIWHDDLFVCTRAGPNAPWSRRKRLGSHINSTSNDKSAALSGDGLTLVFRSNRPGPGTQGNQDLWLCTRERTDQHFGNPIHLGPTINSPEWDGPAMFSDPNTLIFGRGGVFYQATIDRKRLPAIARKPRPAIVETGKNFALSFDGKDDYVEIPKLQIDSSKPFTVEAWIDPKSRSGKRIPFHAIGPRGGAYLMMYQAGQQRMGIHGGVFGPHTGGVGGLTGNARTHLALVQTDGKRLLFANGRLIQTGMISGSDSFADTPGAYIGVRGIKGKSPNGWFHGTIDEARISNVARYTENFTPEIRFESDKNTLALYHFDKAAGDVLKDSSGNNHHGKIHGANWVNADGTPPKPPNDLALLFDGKGDYVEIPTLNYKGEMPYTIEFVVKPRSNRGFTRVIAADGPSAIGVALNRGVLEMGRGSTSNAKLTWQAIQPGARFKNNTVYHIACVFEKGNWRLFVDGVRLKTPVPSTKGYKSIDRPPQPFIFGANYIVYKELQGFFHGTIDEVRISNVARYSENFTPANRFESDKHTLALYHFNEGKGDVLKDSSGNNHHGKIHGATWVNPDGTVVKP